MNANTKDVSAGLLFIAVAALFALGTQELDFGTARKLGPGAFPLLLAGALGLLGLVIVVRAFRNPATHQTVIPWRGILLIVAAPVVFGLTVRSRDFGSNFTASFRSLGGGEVPEYTQMLAESRHVAVMRMCQMAQQMGANAILAMRFDCNEIAQTMSEVAAYGTAVVVHKVEPPRVQDSSPDEDDANDS